MNSQLQTPVVFIVFNRPSLTRRVFSRIAQARPSRLLVIADGPRRDRPGESEKCEEARLIATSVDWPCQVEVEFSSENMGCRDRIVRGLNWAFERVEEAIILEDDVLPDPSFFPFCEQMLGRYRGDARVSMIAGFNIVQEHLKTDYSYFFSQLTHIWGWATWRQSWARYDQHLNDWPEIKSSGLLREIFDRPGVVAYWTKIFDSMHDGSGLNTWDYQWMYTNLMHNALSVVPHVNLVENLGFGPDATHTITASDVCKLTAQSIKFPLLHPPSLVPLRQMDRVDAKLSGSCIPTLPERAVRRFKHLWTKALEIGVER